MTESSLKKYLYFKPHLTIHAVQVLSLLNREQVHVRIKLNRLYVCIHYCLVPYRLSHLMIFMITNPLYYMSLPLIYSCG